MIRPAIDVIVALERECLIVDKALEQKRWADCETSWRAQRRLTHELDIALREVKRGTPESQALFKRIDRLVKYRDAQLKRLETFSAAVGKRLRTIRDFGAYSKAVGAERAAGFLDVNR